MSPDRWKQIRADYLIASFCYVGQIVSQTTSGRGEKMIKTRIAGLLAAPAIAIAIFGGASLALAGSASADYYDNSSSYSDFSGDFTTSSFFAHPTTYADPAPGLVPWATWINQ